MMVINWIGQQIGNGLQWLVEQGANGLLKGMGSVSRFVVNNCDQTFVLFGLVGVFLIMANAKEKGMKMINLSIIVFLVMQILGACL